MSIHDYAVDVLGAYTAVGDFFYLPSDRDYGQGAVQQLFSFYKSVDYQPSRFTPAVSTIKTRAERLTAGPADYANWKALGDQAQALTKEIAAALKLPTGEPTPPPPELKPEGPKLRIPKPSDLLPEIPGWAWALGGVLGSVLVLGGGYAIYRRVTR